MQHSPASQPTKHELLHGTLKDHDILASNLLASLLLVAMPGAPSSFLFLGVRPGAPSSVLAPSYKVAVITCGVWLCRLSAS